MASAVYKILNSTGGVFGIAILPLVLMNRIIAEAARANVDMSVIRQHKDIIIMGFDSAFKFGMFVCLAGLIFTILARDKKV